MLVIFTWDGRKAAANLKKHGVEFNEAATVFYAPYRRPFPDEDHSRFEHRFLTIGESVRGQILVVAHTEESDTIRVISAGSLVVANEGSMKKKNRGIAKNGLRAEYDFASMKRGVRGKYLKRFQEGTNIVLIEPEVAAAFPNDQAVNQALRGVLNTARAGRNSGGLANKALRPRPGAAKRKA